MSSDDKRAYQSTFTNEVDVTTTKKAPIVVTEIPPSGLPRASTFTFSWGAAQVSTELTHGLHSYPAKFIPQFPRWGIRNFELKPGDILLDPFCGSGTTMVEGRLNGINTVGCEVNPLGKLLSLAKSTPLMLPEKAMMELKADFSRSLFDASGSERDYDKFVKNMPENWDFWFPNEALFSLWETLNIIESYHSEKLDDQQNAIFRQYLIALYSSVIKKVSYFDEEQIKVKKAPKKLADGIPSIKQLLVERLTDQYGGYIRFSELCRKYPYTRTWISSGDARSTALESESVDGIITSPPYINAIDYPMAHKYNLFICRLLDAVNYRDHCRKYIGITERAIGVNDYRNMQKTGFGPVDEIIEKIYTLDSTNTSKNRAFITYQYFDGMRTALREFYRVLKADRKIMIVLGSNRIRGVFVPTHELILQLAQTEGFVEDNHFYHRIKLRKLGLPRNGTGGVIEDEMVMVLKKD